MAVKKTNHDAASAESFVPQGIARLDLFKTLDAMLDAMRRNAGQPRPSPDPDPGYLTAPHTDITEAFTELEREGKVCAYVLFERAVLQRVGILTMNATHVRNLWQSVTREREGLERGYKGDHARVTYGQTVTRSLRKWVAVVERVLSDAEGDAHRAKEREWGEAVPEPTTEGLLKYAADRYQVTCKRAGVEQTAKGLREYRVERFGMPDMTDAQLRLYYVQHTLPGWFRNGTRAEQFTATGPTDPAFPPPAEIIPSTADVTTDERHRRWIADYTNEVRYCADKFADSPALPIELTRLAESLGAFEVGKGEGEILVNYLRTIGAGSDALGSLEHCRTLLVASLKEVCEHYTADQPALNESRMEWQGSQTDLCELFRVLHDKGYLVGQRSKMARAMAAAFVKHDGKPFDLGSMLLFTKEKYANVPRKGVAFTANKNPGKP